MMRAELERVELALRDSVQSPDPRLTEVASHLILAGGKRLRPAFAITAARVGQDTRVSDAVIAGAVACELVHLGSLYHDDVMDESDTRRGVETVNARWGNLRAILAGDFLLARASSIAADLGADVAVLLSDAIARLCEGQFEEMCHTFDPDRTQASYLSSIEGKTAALFATSARIGAQVARHPVEVVDAITQAAVCYGMVFQIVDDVLDLTATATQLGKPAGHDLLEGVYTLPVLITLESATPAARELQGLLASPRGPEALDSESLDRALAIVRSGPGLAAAVDVARSFATQAAALRSHLPAGQAADALCHAPGALLEGLTID